MQHVFNVYLRVSDKEMERSKLYPAMTFKNPCDSDGTHNWSAMHMPDKKW